MAQKIIQLRGMIGLDEEATPEYLERELIAAGGRDVRIEVNSPGGHMFAGLEMANQIRRYSGHTTARVVGLAASMASYIPMMADVIEVEDNTVFMIHNPSTFAFGIDHKGAEKLSSFLKGITRLFGKAYVDRTGKSPEEIAQLMDEETFLYGQEIVSEKFADSVVGEESEGDKVTTLALAVGEIKACEDLLKEAREPVQMDKIAAFMGESKQPEKKTMDLKEFLNKNPEAKAEHDAAIQASVEAEHDKVLADAKEQDTTVVEAMKVAVPILSAEYPESVKEYVTALAKAGDVEGVKAIVKMHDATAEAIKAKVAEAEQGAETPADPPSNESNDGTVLNASQLPAEVTRFKAQFGAGGK